eukprot:2312157-Pleurochrysis_carterae.AAC.1
MYFVVIVNVIWILNLIKIGSTFHPLAPWPSPSTFTGMRVAASHLNFDASLCDSSIYLRAQVLVFYSCGSVNRRPTTFLFVNVNATCGRAMMRVLDTSGSTERRATALSLRSKWQHS